MHEKATDLLVITNLDRAQEAAGRLLVDDNGAEADGNAWAIPARQLPAKALNEITGPEGAGYLVHGVTVTPYTGHRKQRQMLNKRFNWCGFSSRGEAYCW